MLPASAPRRHYAAFAAFFDAAIVSSVFAGFHCHASAAPGHATAAAAYA
jgi:hypothetical protein